MSPSKNKPSLRVAINGMGRVGRRVFRQGWSNLNIVAVNGTAPANDTAHFLRYDSIHGPWGKEVTAQKGHLIVEGRKVACFQKSQPEDIPWELLQADIVLECSGRFKQARFWQKAFAKGVKTVIVSAPEARADWTMIYGINHKSYDKSKHRLISAASCTSNCLAPLLQVLKSACGVRRGFFSTVHAYTNDQRLLDSSHKKDLRRARSAGLNIIPTETGANRALRSVFPKIAPRLQGMAFRVPTANVSLLDLTVETETKTQLADIKEAFRQSAASNLKGILSVEEKPLVSSDFISRTESAIVDLPLIRLEESAGERANNQQLQLKEVAGAKAASQKTKPQSNGGDLLKLTAWYDNEAGFSQRLIDFIQYIESQS